MLPIGWILLCSSLVISSGEVRFIGCGFETEPFGYRQKVCGRLSFNGGDFSIDFLLGWFRFAIGVGQRVIGTNVLTRFLGPLGPGTGNGGRKIRVVLLPNLDRGSGTANEISGRLAPGTP